jgi:cytosine/adenosine deaminase-related metal-dependent hydrolase
MILSSSQLITVQGIAPINNGAIAINQGTILAVGPAERIIKKYPGHRVVHLENSVLLPGLVNLHTHLELPPLLDIIRAKTFSDWVLNLIKKKKELTAGDYAIAATQNIKTLIHTGTTTVAEICTQNVSHVLLKQSGLRAVIFHEVISMNPLSPVPRIASLVSRPSSQLLETGISPHAPHTVSERVLREIKKIALKKNLRLCMHVAESKDETRLLQGKKSGFEKLYKAAGWDRSWAPSADSPFEYLHELGLLGPRFLAVHAVQVTDQDICLIKKSSVPIAHCPRSNRETGVGKMPLKKYFDAGISVGIGTDSLASSPSLNMWDEMRYALRIHQRDGITAQDIVTLSTIGGAKALDMNRDTGSLEPGKRADIIAVPLPGKNTGDIYSDLLRETKSCIMTMVDGKIVHRKDL